jgi:release factor glutamine methyltransferase
MRFDPTVRIDCRSGVYEPAEDTRLLIDAISVSPGERVLEVGCGSGIISLHCAKSGALVTASDISRDAAECARENALSNDLEIEVLESDMLDGINGRFDLILFNPPYLPDDHPKDRRWTGGGSGYEEAIRFLNGCIGHLTPGGKVLTIVSSLSDQNSFERAAVKLRYRFAVVSEGKMFFERIYVYELEATDG